jgi:hypothetical protein
MGLQYKKFRGEAFSSAGELLGTFGIKDPRVEYGKEKIYNYNINFSIIFPFYNNIKTFEISNVTTNDTIVSVNLTETLQYYCNGIRYNNSECHSLDLDDDGIEDYRELYGGQIQGIKWEDTDGNGEKDIGEQTLSGWQIELNGKEDIGIDVYMTTVTGEDGRYIFTDIEPGAYFITEYLKDGWYQTAPAYNNGRYYLNIVNGSFIKDQNFGNRRISNFSNID